MNENKININYVVWIYENPSLNTDKTRVFEE